MNKKVFLFLAEGFEEVEALTVIDLLRRAKIHVMPTSISKSLMVAGAHNIKVSADFLFEQVEDFESDMLILPGGGLGVENLEKFEPLKELLLEFDKENKNISAICAAPSILGNLNLLKGRKACCYPGFEKMLLGAEVVYDKVVVDGNIITSRALGTAIDFSLKIIEVLESKELAEEIKEEIVFL